MGQKTMDIDAIAIRGLDRETVDDSRSARSRAPCSSRPRQPAVRNRISFGRVAATCGLPPALVLHGVVLSFLSVHCTKKHPSNRFRDSLAQRLVPGCGGLMLPPRIFSVVPFRPSPFHPGPGGDPELAAASSTLVSYLWCVRAWPYWYDRLAVTLRHALAGRVTSRHSAAQIFRLIVRQRALCGAVIFACYWPRSTFGERMR